MYALQVEWRSHHLRIIAFSAIALGSVLAVGALLADVIGIGGGGEELARQMIAAIAGIVIALSGVAFLLKPGG